MKVRTRFAPSPTGYLHVGALRTALFAWLVARQNGGQFILRLEDTDQSREVEGADKHLIKSLNSLGLNYDEGPDVGGPHGPYRQSDRLDIYKKWAQKLLDTGRAYVDPYSGDEVTEFRDQAQKAKKAFLFRDHRPAEINSDWNGDKPLRFKSEPMPYNWHDEVMGRQSTGPEVIDDFIIMKSDGFPTYNFAHIVDDQEMQISHVMRGQEFLASTPNYLNLYEALDIKPPILASMPPIMNEAGNKKLSKRDGAKDALEYIEQGIPIEAFLNFIATLGWNDGSEQEIFTVKELINKFSLQRVQKSGARFDEKRLLWTSGAHIRNMPLDDLYELVNDFWPESSNNYDQGYKKSVLKLVQERLKFYKELPQLTDFFFVDLPINPGLIKNHKQLKKFSIEELQALLEATKEALSQIDNWNTVSIQDCLNELLEKSGQKPAILFSLIRIATTQSPSSPGLSESLEIIGRDRSMSRIDSQLAAFAKNKA